MLTKHLLICFFLPGLLILEASGQQQPENPGFEFWEEIGYGPDTLEPVDWNSLKTSDGGDMINDVIPVTWERTTDAHSGMYAVRLFNEPILTLVAPGTLTNGRVHAAIDPADAYVFTIDSLAEFNTPFFDKPDSLTVWAKFFPVENDVAHVIAILHTDTARIADPAQTNWSAVANIDIPEQLNEWTRLSAPFEYLTTDTPEYILFAMYAGDAQNSLVGSVLYLDDFGLIYYNTEVHERVSQDYSFYVSGDELIFYPGSSNITEPVNLEILDLTGRTVIRRHLNQAGTGRISLELLPGVYIGRIETATYTGSQKFVRR
jgi:hypothetical protein